MQTKQHFAVLDGLRGVAALAVVLYHSFDGGGLVPNGRLAVDLFFILSGFVIAHSYGDRLRVMPGRDFLLSRFVRLYPMLLLGALGGVAVALIHNRVNPANAYALQDIAASGGLSLLALPYLAPPLGDNVFSFNPPIWSLFFEIVANLVYLVFARVLTIRVLLVMTLAGLAGVVAFGPLGGSDKAHFIAGFPRVLAGFFGGVLLYKLRQAGRAPRISAGIALLSAAILVLFAFPARIGGWLYLPTFALLWLIVCAGSQAQPAKSDPGCRLLGLISYPVYVLHLLTLYVAVYVGKRLGLSGALYPVVAIAHLMAIPLIGYLAARWYETPARRWLASVLKRPPPAALDAN